MLSTSSMKIMLGAASLICSRESNSRLVRVLYLPQLSFFLFLYQPTCPWAPNSLRIGLQTRTLLLLLETLHNSSHVVLCG